MLSDRPWSTGCVHIEICRSREASIRMFCMGVTKTKQL